MILLIAALRDGGSLVVEECKYPCSFRDITMDNYRAKRPKGRNRSRCETEIRDRWIQIRVTSTEHSVARARAAKLGLSVSDLLMGPLRREVASRRPLKRAATR